MFKKTRHLKQYYKYRKTVTEQCVKNLVIQSLADFEGENIMAMETKKLINNCDGKNIPQETVKEMDEYY